MSTKRVLDKDTSIEIIVFSVHESRQFNKFKRHVTVSKRFFILFFLAKCFRFSEMLFFASIGNLSAKAFT